MPGGNQPPATHCHPDAGCGVVQPAGVADGAGAHVTGDETAAGGVIPGGSHPPP